MRRIPIESTSIASVGYDPERHELDIEFRDNGKVYRYFGVPAEEHAALMAAESKGAYINQVFKPRGYKYAVVRRGEKKK